MKKFLNTILVVDGSYMLQRAMRQPDLAILRARDGKPSGGVFGFLRMFNSVVTKNPGYYPIVCWDKGRSPRRLALYPNYKHQADHIANPIVKGSEEDEFLSSLRVQREAVIEYLTSIRVPCIRIPDWEGDDLVYLISQSSKKCMIVSDDKDMIQMCSPTCKINRVMHGDIITYETCDDFYRYPQYEYYKAIIGDPSDNLPKTVEGIGGRSAEVIANTMARFVKDSECSPHDYAIIFNYLRSSELEPIWKSVRGLSKKISSFIDNLDRFTLNMKLMDFNYVEEPVDMQTIIESQVTPTITRRPSIMEAYKILGAYSISEIDPGATLSRLVGSSTVFLKDAD